MTAVDFYRKELMALVSTDKTQFKTESEIFEKAKEMEKQQIKDAYFYGSQDLGIVIRSQEQYYNETFKNK